ncbi:MAG: DUF882 domain-containing protein [Alsobacter sp.]
MAKRPLSRRALRGLSCGAASIGVVALTTAPLQTAIATGETRTLEIYHTHTKESASITYKRYGQFDRDGLEKLNWILRDWRRDEPINMDPRLFDIVWEVRKEVGSSEAVNIVSAYRAPETNAMLRHRSRAVAKHSQHMLGKAMDFFLPDASMAKVREVGLRLQRGGVGYYPTAYNPFVHLDAGSVRMWPRMTRDQLARVFPDGKTVFIPTDGKPMPGYDVAAAEIQANGGSVSAYASAGDEDGPGFFSNRKGKSFFAALFGGGDDEDAAFVASQRGGKQAKGAGRTKIAAYAPASAADDGSRIVRDTSDAAAAPARPPKSFEQQVIRPTPEPEASPPATAAAAAQEPAPAPASPAPVPAAGPQVADVPIPAPRPVALASLQAPGGPAMAWQQGPAGQVSPEPDAKVVANVPLPLARPSDISAIFATVPLPRARQVQVASTSPVVPATIEPSLPPVLAGTAVVTPPSAVLAYAAAPVPHARPSAVPLKTTVAPPAESIDAKLTTGTFDKDGLNALFASASLAPSHALAPTVSTARTRVAERPIAGLTAKPSTAIAQGFGNAPAGDLHADRFTGPAVRPLPVANFAKN